jgi:hypothetical protein
MIVEIALSNKTLEVSADRKTIEIFTGGVISGGGATNLAYTASPTNGIVTSDTGTDATLPAGSTTNASLILPADKTKLDGIANGATANSTDAQLRDRTTHTGSQSISTVTGLQTALDGKISSNIIGITGADAITNAVSLTTAEYNAIATPNASTLYIITDAT